MTDDDPFKIYPPKITMPKIKAGLGASTIETILSSGTVSNALAQSLVDKADPIARSIVDKNRTIIADAVISGLPYGVVGTLAAIGTYYFAPDNVWYKAAGYGAASLLYATSAWMSFSQMRSDKPAAAPTAPLSPTVQSAVDQASTAIVAAATPKVQAIIDNEKARLAAATQQGIPWVAVAFVGAAATYFLIPDEKNLYKFLGYGGSAVVSAVGTYLGLEALK